MKIFYLDQVGLTPTTVENLIFITPSRQAARAGNAPGTVAGHLHPLRGVLFHPAFSPRLRASAVKIFYLDQVGLTPTTVENLIFITPSRQAAKAGNASGTVAGRLHPFRGVLFHPAFSPRLRASAVKISYLDQVGLTLTR